MLPAMNERVREHDCEHEANQANGDRLTFAEAAARLGLSRDAVRMRVRRGALPSVRIDGRPYVILAPNTVREHDRKPAEPVREHDEHENPPDDRLVAALTDRIAALERIIERRDAELADRAEEIRRRDHLLAGLIERIPALPETAASDAVVDANQALGRAKTTDMGLDAAPPAASPWSRFLRWLRGSEPS